MFRKLMNINVKKNINVILFPSFFNVEFFNVNMYLINNT